MQVRSEGAWKRGGGVCGGVGGGCLGCCVKNYVCVRMVTQQDALGVEKTRVKNRNRSAIYPLEVLSVVHASILQDRKHLLDQGQIGEHVELEESEDNLGA